MTLHEFGQNNKDVILLIHPSLVMWDYFEYVIPLLEDRYHLIVPAIPGYDEEDPGDFTSVEKIASSLADQLEEQGIREIACMYGCSMGGSIVTRFLADRRTFDSCNNYKMPKAVRTNCGHIEYWYASAEEKERKWDIEYFAKNLPQTIFRRFENIGHGGLALLKPELLAAEIERIIGEE